MKSRIVASDSDLFGIVLYNVRSLKNALNLQGIYLLQELSLLDAARIRQTQELANITKGEFESRFGFLRGNCELSDLFWVLSHLHSLNAPRPTYTGRVLLFTEREEPCQANHARAATQRATDLQTTVQLELLPLAQPDAPPFDLSKFWTSCLLIDPSAETEINDYLHIAASTFDTLRARVRMKQFRQRRLSRLTWVISPSVKVGVSMYTTILQARKPTPVRLSKVDQTILKCETSSRCEETGKELANSDMDYYFEYGPDYVQFTKEERNELLHSCSQGMHLIGFKSRSSIPWLLSIGHGLLCRPDNDIFSGSSTFFAALINSLRSKDKVALVRCAPRSNSTARMAALIPQVNEGDSAFPDGLLFIPLPFADDVRITPLPTARFPRHELEDPNGSHARAVGAMKAVLKGLRAPGFSSGTVQSPVLQQFFAALEALALNAPHTMVVNNGLVPDVAASKLQQESESFLEIVDADASMMSGTKAPVTAPSLSDMKAAVQNGTASKFTVDVLKAFLRSQGKPVSGKKADLLNLIERIVI